MLIFINAFLIGTASGMKSPDWIDRRQLGSPLRHLPSRPHLARFPRLCVDPVHFDPHGDRRADQRQVSEDSEPIGTSSVHHQNRCECSVRSCDWAS